MVLMGLEATFVLCDPVGPLEPKETPATISLDSVIGLDRIGLGGCLWRGLQILVNPYYL